MAEQPFKETDEETGISLIIEHDPDPMDPVSGDESVRFAVLHRQYVNPAEEHGLTSVEAIAEFEAANAGDDSEWIVFPLWMIDHSGTGYLPSRDATVNPYNDPWDSGRVGIIALKRGEFAGDVFESATAICGNYTDWANGNAWGYLIEGPDGEPLDSCWGYIGPYDDDYIMGEARDSFESAKRSAREAKASATADEMTAARPDLYT